MLLQVWQGGVLAALLGSFCGTLGGQLRINSLTCKARAAAVLQVFGWTSWLIGQGLGQVAILLAPATVAACVTFSSSLLCNALLAPLVLHEQLTRVHGYGVVLLTMGGTLVTVSSDHSSQEYSWAELRAFWHRPPFLATAAACCVCVLGITANAMRNRTMDVWSFAFLFAFCGSVDLLVAKYTLEMLRLIAEHRHSPLLPGGATVLAFTSLMVLLHLATLAFQVASAYYRKALQSMPLFLGSGCMVQVSLCGIFYEEFGGFTSLRALGFLSGLVLVLAGMVVTSHAATGPPQLTTPPPVTRTLSEESPTPYQEFIAPTAGLPSGLREDNSGMPIISSGLFERSSDSLNSADSFLVWEMQRSAACFGGQFSLARSPVGLHRKFESAPTFKVPVASMLTPATATQPRPITATAPPAVLDIARGMMPLPDCIDEESLSSKSKRRSGSESTLTALRM